MDTNIAENCMQTTAGKQPRGVVCMNPNGSDFTQERPNQPTTHRLKERVDGSQLCKSFKEEI